MDTMIAATSSHRAVVGAEHITQAWHFASSGELVAAAAVARFAAEAYADAAEVATTTERARSYGDWAAQASRLAGSVATVVAIAEPGDREAVVSAQFAARAAQRAQFTVGRCLSASGHDADSLLAALRARISTATK